jgi:hypothetical protein
MKRIIFLLLLSIVVTTHLYSQVEMRGTITTLDNDKPTPVEFANIVLYSASDTTKMIAGTVSDLKGNYLFEYLEMGRYHLVISYLGYKTLSQPMRVVMPSSGDFLKRDFTLEQDTQMLSEVTVEGQLRRQYIDKASYTFTSQDVKSARYSKDLLQNLPELMIDAQSQNIKTLKGASLLILINGVASTDNDLKLLPPDKVLRVEYYDFPPARYAGAGAVANIITRSLNDGYGGGVDLSHAVTTGFGNDNAYFGYNSARNQFSLEYRISYRDYKDRENEDVYRYNLNDEERESFYFRKNKFGYTTHTIGLKYTNQLMDNYIFQVSLRPNFETRFEDGTSAISNTFGNDKTSFKGTNESNTDIISPVADVYYWKALPNKSEISANIVGTMFRTSVEDNAYEYLQPSQEQTLKDEMKLENRKQSIIGEVAYTKKFGLTGWNLGYRLDASWLDSDINNLLGSFNYESRYTEQYLYTELSGMKNKLLYRISLGGKYLTNKSYSNEYNQFVFTPLAMLGYQINNHNTLRLLLQRDSKLPSVSDLSNNAQVITSDIISKGNPLLQNATGTGGGFIYTHNNRFLNLDAAIVYNYTDKAINQYFTHDEENNYIALTKENAIYAQQFGGYVAGQIKPFGTDIFSIRTSAQFVRQQLKSNLVGNIYNWYVPINIYAVFQTQKWMLSYEYRFTSNNLEGAYLVRDENQSNFMARYKYNNRLSFSAGLLWAFTPSHYYRETLPGSLAFNQRDTKIYDNKSMIVLGVSWNFNKGKDYSTKRTMMNEDKDAGTF